MTVIRRVKQVVEPQFVVEGAGVLLRRTLWLIASSPIEKLIVPSGPFVMNTEAEVRQTLAELRAGTFAKDTV